MMYKRLWLVSVLMIATPCMQAHAASGSSASQNQDTPQALAPSYLPDAPFVNATTKDRAKRENPSAAKTPNATSGERPKPAQTLAPSYLPDAPLLKQSAKDHAKAKSTEP